jgi:hypothetical protein
MSSLVNTKSGERPQKHFSADDGHPNTQRFSLKSKAILSDAIKVQK